MSVTIGFRLVRTTDRCQARMTTVRLPSFLDWFSSPLTKISQSVCHCEVSLTVPCCRVTSGACRYCDIRHSRIGTKQHVLGFSVTGTTGNDRVFCTVDREYGPQDELNPEWLFYESNIGDNNTRDIKRFLQSQHGKKFNRLGVYFNFFRLPFTRFQPFAFGCKLATSSESLDYECHTSWFCSELVVAATQHLGLCQNQNPCQVSPTALFIAVVDNPAFSMVTKPGIVVGATKPAPAQLKPTVHSACVIDVSTLYSNCNSDRTNDHVVLS